MPPNLPVAAGYHSRHLNFSPLTPRDIENSRRFATSGSSPKNPAKRVLFPTASPTALRSSSTLNESPTTKTAPPGLPSLPKLKDEGPAVSRFAQNIDKTAAVASFSKALSKTLAEIELRYFHVEEPPYESSTLWPSGV